MKEIPVSDIDPGDDDPSHHKQTKQQLKEINDILKERVEERTQSLISYQKQLRSLASRLSHAEEQERHRLAGELHDNLGQMLAVNKMKLDMLVNSGLSKEVTDDIREIRKGLEEAMEFTRNLMSNLKPPPSLDKEDVTVTIEWLANKMKEQHLEVTVEDDGEPKRTTENIRTTLLQCVRELLFNIIKHTDEDKARIRMLRQEDIIQIKVEDEGPGLQYSDSREESSTSGGFGLFNIRERIDLLGGQTEFHSEPGNGTTITLKVPLKGEGDADAPGQVQGGKQKPSTESPSRKVKVMLADDHQMLCQGLKEILEKEEDLVVVAEASDGSEALEQAQQAEPDIILMDLNMPGMNGVEATRRLKKDLSEVRIIGLSAYENEQMIEELYNAGATAFLSKKESFETLCATIRSETHHLLDNH